MPTYASTASFDLAIDDIVEEAFERCGLQDRTGYEIKTARRSLDIMFADWANRGLNLWTIQKQEKTITSASTNPLTGTDLYGSGANDSQQIIDITNVIMRQASGSDSNDYECTRIGRDVYWGYTVKSTSSRPTQFYFERTINPSLYLYPVPDTTYTLIYYALSRMFDAGDYTNNAQVPFRFIPCMVAGLAYYMAMKYAPDRIQLLKQIYEEEFKRAADTDRETANFNFTPEWNYLT